MERLKGIREKHKLFINLIVGYTLGASENYNSNTISLEGIQVVYINPKNTSRRCHRCGYITKANGREFRCPKRGLTYNRDLNASINIAHTLTRGMGWGIMNPRTPK